MSVGNEKLASPICHTRRWLSAEYNLYMIFLRSTVSNRQNCHKQVNTCRPMRVLEFSHTRTHGHTHLSKMMMTMIATAMSPRDMKCSCTRTLFLHKHLYIYIYISIYSIRSTKHERWHETVQKWRHKTKHALLGPHWHCKWRIQENDTHEKIKSQTVRTYAYTPNYVLQHHHSNLEVFMHQMN